MGGTGSESNGDWELETVWGRGAFFFFCLDSFSAVALAVVPALFLLTDFDLLEAGVFFSGLETTESAVSTIFFRLAIDAAFELDDEGEDVFTATPFIPVLRGGEGEMYGKLLTQTLASILVNMKFEWFHPITKFSALHM